MRARKELRFEDLVAVIDSREQWPLDLTPLRSERAGLSTGDYSIKGLEHVIAVERKSLPDLLGCIGSDRERFEREIQRLLAYESRAIFVECTFEEFEAGNWRSKVKPSAAMGSVLGWISRGIPIFFTGNHERTGKYVSRFLYISARRRWREMQALAGNLRIVGE